MTRLAGLSAVSIAALSLGCGGQAAKPQVRPTTATASAIATSSAPAPDLRNPCGPVDASGPNTCAKVKTGPRLGLRVSCQPRAQGGIVVRAIHYRARDIDPAPNAAAPADVYTDEVAEVVTTTRDRCGRRVIVATDAQLAGRSDGELRFAYDARGNRLREIASDLGGAPLRGIKHYAYDERDRMVSYARDRQGDGSIDLQTFYRYNDQGLIIHVATDQDGDGSIDLRCHTNACSNPPQLDGCRFECDKPAAISHDRYFRE